MTDTTSPLRPEDLSIRAAPAPVRRFSKRALGVLLATAAAVILISFAFALQPRSGQSDTAGRELYSTTNKPSADGLSDLPASYADLPRAPDPIPELGPALPGDLGAPMLRAERQGRVTISDASTILPVEPDAGESETAALAAARLAEARESGLFFTKAAPPARGLDRTVSGSGRQAPADPLAMLQSLELGAGSGRGSLTDQDRKRDFVSTAGADEIYNPYALQMPRSPYQVMAGAIIPATLLTGVNSDLPGQVIAQVTEPVFDTVTGQHVLIPQGTRVLGRYDSVIAYGQSRALIVWTRLIMPDGSSIQIENLPAVDGRGNAGLADRVDHHAWRLFSAAALSSLISIGAELSSDDEDEIARALRDAGQDGAARVGEEIVRRQLAVQPTITIRPGWRLRILVHQDIILKPYGAF